MENYEKKVRFYHKPEKPNLSKNELNEAIDYLRILSRLLDITYKNRINNICFFAKK